MEELLGLLVCVSFAASGAGKTFAEGLRRRRNVVFSALVTILSGLSLLLAYTLAFYGALFVLRMIYSMFT